MFNVVDPGLYTVDQFEAEKYTFIQALNKTEAVNNFFFTRFK